MFANLRFVSDFFFTFAIDPLSLKESSPLSPSPRTRGEG
jgi:hypothetical protein